MSAPNDNGEVRTQRAGHVVTITVDRSAKMNGFTPEMFDALSDALTQLDEDPDLWVGVLTFAGKHTTAGLDLPRFAAAFAADGRSGPVDARVDGFALKRRCRKPLVAGRCCICSRANRPRLRKFRRCAPVPRDRKISPKGSPRSAKNGRRISRGVDVSLSPR